MTARRSVHFIAFVAVVVILLLLFGLFKGHSHVLNPLVDIVLFKVVVVGEASQVHE